jgi:predicted DNA-binding protein with PD1-like motif
MKARLLGAGGGQRTFAVVFDTGDEVPAGLLAFAAAHDVTGASFTAIGAFQRATLGYFEIARREYARIEIAEQVEVLTLAGNVAVADGERKVHAHVVLGKADGSAHGGHLLSASVRPTLEVVLVETPTTLRRTVDAATGLPLLSIDQPTA